MENFPHVLGIFNEEKFPPTLGNGLMFYIYEELGPHDFAADPFLPNFRFFTRVLLTVRHFLIKNC